MQIREHAEANPERPAVLLDPSGKQVSFAEMEARANRLAHRPGGPAWSRVTPSGAHGEQRVSAHRDVGGAAQRPVLRGDQHASHPARGGLHNRQQRRQGCHRVAADGEDPRRPRRAPTEGLPGLPMIADDDLDGWQRYPDVSPTSRTLLSLTSSRAICCSTRRERPDFPREFAGNCPMSRPPRCRTCCRHC